MITKQKNNGIFKAINKSFIFFFLRYKLQPATLILKGHGAFLTNAYVVFTTCT